MPHTDVDGHTYPPNRYEEVINEGRLEQDTEPEEEPMPPPDDNSLDAQASRTVAKYPQRLKALLKRSGGHPYQTGDLLPYQVSCGSTAKNVHAC